MNNHSVTEFLLGLASLLADLSGIDLSAHDAPFQVWLSLVEHLCERLVRLFAAIFEGIAKLLTAAPVHVARAYRWLGWRSPRGRVRQIVTLVTRLSCAHPFLPSQRRREAAQPRARWDVALPRSQLDTGLRPLAGGASTGKPANTRCDATRL